MRTRSMDLQRPLFDGGGGESDTDARTDARGMGMKSLSGSPHGHFSRSMGILFGRSQSNPDHAVSVHADQWVADDAGTSELYNYWSFKAVKMEDVLEDGMPPDQRAGVQPLHLNLQVTFGNTSHLPNVFVDSDQSSHRLEALTHSVIHRSVSNGDAGLAGACPDTGRHSNAVISIAFQDQLVKTRVHLSSTADSEEGGVGSLNLFVHSIDTEQALEAARSPGDLGPSLKLDCSSISIISHHMGVSL